MMSFNKVMTAVLVVFIGFVGTSCTERSPKGVVVPQTGTGGDGNTDTTVSPDGNFTGDSTPETGGSIGAEWLAKDMKAQGVVDVSKLTFKLTYLNVTREGALTVSGTGDAQKVSLVAKSLPTGQAGKLVLQLLESGVVKLQGESDVTLKAGVANSAKITLIAMGGGVVPPTVTTPNTSDLTIDVGVGPNTTTTTPTNPTNPTNPNTTTNPQPPTTTDLGALGNWDGRSHLGNDRWTIETVR